MELPKHYEPKEVEERWIQQWEKKGIYKFDPNSDKEIFSIDTPPPTVSGKMHMGHAFGNSQQDFIARYKRMKGYNVLQPFGTDDNGLPTQILIEKLKGVKARSMGRDDFSSLCLTTLENELRPKYISDWKRLGISCDFNVFYTTINSHCTAISQWSFLDLHQKGRVYQKEAPVMWCPKCETAIAQVETVDQQITSSFNDIIFKVGNEKILIATTRPELLPACVAVFYHPEDERYQHLKGKKARVPLFNFEVPILPDERANPEKGTGIVMCCTFGDQTDMEWQKAHSLPIKTAINKSGKLTEIAGKYAGLDVKTARKEILDEMKEQGLLEDQKPITHPVNCHERCGTEIEYFHSKQWFIRYLDLKPEMEQWGEELHWYPPHMKNRYENWVKGLQWDWCISRQIYFGTPFPVWHCQECEEVILARKEDLPVDPLKDEPPVEKCPKCSSKKIIGEKDIINTWATSSLTPTIVKELFKGRKCYTYLKENPMNMRPQGHDIITFWLFSTVAKSQMHYQMKPWHDCFINGWMLDPHGKKMSKSKGNIIEPQEMIDKYSSDILRYMAAGSTLGEDLSFPEKEMVAGKRFTTKLWNATKFCLPHFENYDPKLEKPVLTLTDKWIMSKMNRVVHISTESFDKYEFFKAKAETEKFFWQEFCDYYLEIVKDRLYNKVGTEEFLSAQYTIYNNLLTLLKLFSPFTPFITEEIYHLCYSQKEKEESIHTTDWPIYDESMIDETAEQTGELIMNVISEVRKKKSEKQLSLKEPIKEVKIEGTLNTKDFALIEEDLKQVIKAEKISYKKIKEGMECVVVF